MILEDLRSDIIKVMNDSKVPIDGAYYVMKDIMNELTAVYKEQLDAEAAAKENEEQEQEKNEPAIENIEKEEK